VSRCLVVSMRRESRIGPLGTEPSVRDLSRISYASGIRFNLVRESMIEVISLVLPLSSDNLIGLVRKAGGSANECEREDERRSKV